MEEKGKATPTILTATKLVSSGPRHGCSFAPHQMFPSNVIVCESPALVSICSAPTITENVNYKVPSPIVQMSIRDLNGNPVVSATVGDKIFLQFDLAAAGCKLPAAL